MSIISMPSLFDLRIALDDKLLRHRVKDRSFSIISNNCLGGTIYQQLNLEYSSPFVGLFLYPACYIELLENLPSLIRLPLQFAEESKYSMANEARRINNDYPIGLIDKRIEIHFIHYTSKLEAKEKWERRLARLDLNNLRVLMTERELCSSRHIERFDHLAFKHKICFSSSFRPTLSSVIWIKECNDWPYVTDLMKYRFLYKRRFDLADWLNGGTGQPSFLYRTIESIVCPKKQLKPFKPLPGYMQ